MALIYDGMCCSLCGKTRDFDHPYFASWATPDENGTGCLEHSDAPIHWDCLFSWSEVDRFLTPVYRARLDFFVNNEYWTILEQNEDFSVAHNWINVRVDIARTGLSWDIAIEEWPDSLVSEQQSAEFNCLSESRRQIAKHAIDLIVTRFPKLK